MTANTNSSTRARVPLIGKLLRSSSLQSKEKANHACFALSSVVSLRCHTCPFGQAKDLKACIAHSPQECEYYDNGCFFEYQGRMKKMGCGRDWKRPTGCHDTACIKWCFSSLCNKELVKQSPFRKELDDEENREKDDSEGNWWNSIFGSSASIYFISPGIFRLLLAYNTAKLLL